MFRNVRQCSFLPVLQSFGPAPLKEWDLRVENGNVRRIMDEQVRVLVLEIIGTNVSTCYMRCPKNSRSSLGIHMPYLVMFIKSLNKYFTFEVTILDDRNVHRRFRMSNFQRRNQIHHFCTSMPLCLNSGWNQAYFDLNDLTRKIYKTNYTETVRIQIHANCRIRMIYFCDRIYDEKDLPQKYNLFLPSKHTSHKKKSDETAVKKETLEAPPDAKDETASQSYEEREGEGELILYESSEEMMENEKYERKSLVDEQSALISPIEEEDERYGEEFEDGAQEIRHESQDIEKRDIGERKGTEEMEHDHFDEDALENRD